MKAGKFVSKFGLIFVCALLMTSCLLPGMIPLTPIPTAPMPVMEKDAEAHLERLKGAGWVYIHALVEEKYTAADLAKPGTLKFTAKITDDKPVYFNYSWCTTSEEILKQNFEHITVRLYFNDDELDTDVVHSVSYTRTNGLVCLDIGVLMSDWPAGHYKLESAVTFDEKINDGIDDYEAGDYIHQYNVTVEK